MTFTARVCELDVRCAGARFGHRDAQNGAHTTRIQSPAYQNTCQKRTPRPESRVAGSQGWVQSVYNSGRAQKHARVRANGALWGTQPLYTVSRGRTVLTTDPGALMVYSRCMLRRMSPSATASLRSGNRQRDAVLSRLRSKLSQIQLRLASLCVAIILGSPNSSALCLWLYMVYRT